MDVMRSIFQIGVLIIGMGWLVGAVSSPPPRPLRLYVFLDTECPISQTYTRRLQSTYEKYAANVAIYAIYPTKWVRKSEVLAFEKEYNFHLPRVLDTSHRFVRQYDATTTPEVVLVNKKNEILYRGAIDNQFVGLGKFRAATTDFYLTDALEAALAGQLPKVHSTEPIGCLINR